MNKKIIVIIALVMGVPIFIFLSFLFVKNTDETEVKDSTEVVSEESEKKASLSEATVGEEAPDFTLKNLNGDTVSLSDYRGKKVLVNFWATTCKYCVIEMPDLDKVDKENEDVVVLAVDVMEDENTVRDYIEKGGYGFNVLLDSKGEVARNYLIHAFPTTYGIDEDGKITIAIPGMLTKEQMEQVIAIIDENRGEQ